MNDTYVWGAGGFRTEPDAVGMPGRCSHGSARSVRTFAAKSSGSRHGSVVYRCSSCGETAMQWSGQCMSCKEWSTLEKVAVSAGSFEGGGGRGSCRGEVLLVFNVFNVFNVFCGLENVQAIAGAGIVCWYGGARGWVGC